jgi:putative acetyltransferase
MAPKKQNLVFQIRPIRSADDAAVAVIIRTVMPTFGAVGDGFAINDPEVDFISRAYGEPGCAYFVVELGGTVMGGAGVAPLSGGEAKTCELRKMYFLPELRGLGAGAALMETCLSAARQFGFSECYLETLDEMAAAKKLYEKSGFVRISNAMGSTGHGGCNTFYLRKFASSETTAAFQFTRDAV